MAGVNTLEFNDSNFETEVLKSPTPVLVDFWAPWCMPCKVLGPTIDALADRYAGKVKIGKLDVDVGQDVAMKYNVSAIPTIIIFKNGQQVKRFTGAARQEDLAAAVDAAMAH